MRKYAFLCIWSCKMIGLQITEKGKLTKINKMELCDSVQTSKVKILKVLITHEDLQTLNGDDDAIYPVIPGRVAIGQISDSNESAYLTRGTKVYICPINSCGKCTECLSDNDEGCLDFKIAGKNVNGYLRDFAVVDNRDMHALPPTVSDNDVLLLDYISLALSAIEKLKIQKGEHVAVIGGGILGTILSLLIIYYQAVPILIDNNRENLSRAASAGIYYNLFSDNKLEKEVSDLTGAHMAQKVVYISDSNINTDLALKLASHNAQIGFVGFSSPSLKVNFCTAMKKQLRFVCVTNGYGMCEQAINILANKALDLSVFHFPSAKFDNCENEIKKSAAELQEGNSDVSPIIIDMM